MSRIALAFRAFTAAIFDPAKAQRLREALQADRLPKIDNEANRPPSAAAPKSLPVARSEAITLLGALQREARLIDLVKQPLADFSDEQIGAAARNVLGDCAAVLDRFFALQPTLNQAEGSPLDIPSGYDPGCFKLSGRVEGSGPFSGNLVHHGWKATTHKLPSWSGTKEAADIVAPAEIEI